MIESTHEFPKDSDDGVVTYPTLFRNKSGYVFLFVSEDHYICLKAPHSKSIYGIGETIFGDHSNRYIPFKKGESITLTQR